NIMIFFFQAEDGIRDRNVTGVQTCALPIYDELRTSIMKINRAFPLEKLMKAIDYYLEKTNRRITFEYILIKDVNDQKEHALELAQLLKNKRHLSYVNLIPYNPVSEHIQYERSTPEAIVGFEEVLQTKGI